MERGFNMKRNIIVGLLILGLVTLVGCNSGEKEPTITPGLPETKTDKISMEGVDYDFELYLYDDKDFYTYYPQEDMLPEQTSSDQGEGVIFYANYNEKKNQQVYLKYFMFDDSITSLKELEESHYLTDLGWKLVTDAETDSLYPWTIDQFFIRDEEDKKYLGTLYLGKQDHHLFMFAIHAPGEYAEGFYPRAQKVIEEFHWKISN